MTYVSENIRFTLDESYIKPLKRRSEGRLKAISSNEDLRSWNYTVEDRRRHILDVVKNDIEKCGLLTTAVLHALTLKSKAKLTKSLKQLWAFIMSRDLTEKEKEHLMKLQKQMGYACSQAISNNCPCEGNYDVVCACDDVTGAKQRDRILNVAHSFESKSVPVSLSRELENLKCECTACSEQARRQFLAKTTICGQKGPSDPKKRKIMKAAVSSDKDLFAKTRRHYDRPDTASSDVPSSKRSSRPDTVSDRPRSSRMRDTSSVDDTDPKMKDPLSTSSGSKPSSSPMYTGYEDSPYTTKIKDKSTADDTDSKIKEFSSFTTDDDSKPVSPGTPVSSGYQDDPYGRKIRDTSIPVSADYKDDPYGRDIRDTSIRASSGYKDDPYGRDIRDTSIRESSGYKDDTYGRDIRDTSIRASSGYKDDPYGRDIRDTSIRESSGYKDDPYGRDIRDTSIPVSSDYKDDPYRSQIKDTSTPLPPGYKDVSRALSEKSEGPHIDTAERAVSSTISTCSIDCQCRTDLKTIGLRTEPGPDLISRGEDSESFLCPCRDKATCTPIRPTRTVKLGVHSTLDESSEPYKNLKSKYAELECVCKEQQENIRNIIRERDMLQQKYQKSLSKPIDSSKDIEDLEKQLSEATPEIEASMIKNELEILRQYCLKLKAAEEENEILKREKMESKRQGKPRLRDSKASGVGVSELDDVNKDECEACNSLKMKIKTLERRLAQCSNTIPEDFEIFKNQSLLDNALAERDEMQKKIERIHELESQLDEYKKKAARTEDLENQLIRVQREKTSNYDLRKVQSKCVCVQRELENVKAERDAILKRLDLMKEEMERLRAKAKEAEVLLIERDKLQIKVNGMSHVQNHNENLRLKCKCLENAANERDMYKQKYEEQLNVDNQVEVEDSTKLKRDKELLKKQVGDLQSCIVEQDSEIKRLMEQIDSLIKNKEEVQARMKETLMNMRNEIEKKDRLIAAADKKLEILQAQLKSSIQGVSVETTVYKTRIQELEMELNDAKNQIQKLDASIDRRDTSKRSRSCEYEAVCAMKKDLQAANAENKKLQEIAKNMAILTGDEHVQKMLKQSQYAVRKVVEELSEQYKEWDNLKKERRKPRSGGNPNSGNINQEEELNQSRGIQNSNNQQGKEYNRQALNRSGGIQSTRNNPQQQEHHSRRQEPNRNEGIQIIGNNPQEKEYNRLRQEHNRFEGIQSFSNNPQDKEHNRPRQEYNRSDGIQSISNNPQDKEHRLKQEHNRFEGIQSLSNNPQEKEHNRLRQQLNRSEGSQSSSNNPQQIENRLRQDNDSQTNRKCQGALAARMMQFCKKNSTEK
ncbi:unnamed protein product [Diabrotica balteata]|uniref:Uncharacterized protein n=1 Tax=Diabrotica balteata TaxID=107213 RepID=A0A9N9T6C8_DIABA|nr:unnamed protein product [Diabrotica balteata]